jgi:CRISPR-associated endonuclease Csn1
VQRLHAFNQLPYYGEYLQRHVSFAKEHPRNDEERFGKIANPTVHIGLNQVRVVVNALIKRYGHPAEVIVEVARDLKQNQEQRKEDNERQAKNQKRNERLRADAAGVLQIAPERVRHADIQKMILWEELNPRDSADRKCPYSGIQLSAFMVLSDQVEIEHILPFSQTLDDSLNNKTVATRQANRVKGNRTPWAARNDFAAQGWAYSAILDRAEQMPRFKRYRFGEDGYEKWLKEDKGFLARALNDTRYLSRVAREYLSLVCPQNTRVIPGQMTAMMRAKFGLNDILGLDGEKNRNDHRHHAVDACVIAVTDQGMLQRFAKASASAREKQLNRLVDDMPLPWPTYREHVARAVHNIWVSHKPDHGYEGAMHEDTAWGLLPEGLATRRVRGEDGRRQRETKARSVIPFNSTRDTTRHGLDTQGQPASYKGYVGGSNFCMDIVRSEKGKWEGEIVSTFTAYQLVRELGTEEGLARLRSRTLSISGKPLVMRLQNGDVVKVQAEDRWRLMRIVKMNSQGQISFAAPNEANVSERDANKTDAFSYFRKNAGPLHALQARKVTISPIGELRDPGFKE